MFALKITIGKLKYASCSIIEVFKDKVIIDNALLITWKLYCK